MNTKDIAKQLRTLADSLEKPSEKKWVPEIGTIYYFSDIDSSVMSDYCSWEDDEIDNYRLKNNLVFKTKKQARERTREMLEGRKTVEIKEANIHWYKCPNKCSDFDDDRPITRQHNFCPICGSKIIWIEEESK